MDELIEALCDAASKPYNMRDVQGRADLMERAAAALEAAREDACVALVADIRFACGDNGKRMQPELVEFIRELAKDAERLDWLAGDAVLTSGWREHGTWETPALLVNSTRETCTPRDFRAAIDQARGKGGGEVEGG